MPRIVGGRVRFDPSDATDDTSYWTPYKIGITEVYYGGRSSYGGMIRSDLTTGPDGCCIVCCWKQPGYRQRLLDGLVKPEDKAKASEMHAAYKARVRAYKASLVPKPKETKTPKASSPQVPKAKRINISSKASSPQRKAMRSNSK